MASTAEARQKGAGSQDRCETGGLVLVRSVRVETEIDICGLLERLVDGIAGVLVTYEERRQLT
jgi:hypothetical protein